MPLALLVVLAVLSGAGQIAARRSGPLWLHYLLKPLTVVIIISIAVVHPGNDADYRWLVLLGLFFSLGGDVFLMLPADLFVYGLSAFLLGHLCYIAAFYSPPQYDLASAAVVVTAGVAGVALYRHLLPGLGKLKAAVAFYTAAILLMACLAALRALSIPGVSSSLALSGALLFVVSDSALALDRFRKALAQREVVVMTSYYAAQALIASSVAFT
ncbi:MAG: lysoplasmalogenase [Candidatus Binatia bacterium]